VRSAPHPVARVFIYYIYTYRDTYIRIRLYISISYIYIIYTRARTHTRTHIYAYTPSSSGTAVYAMCVCACSQVCVCVYRQLGEGNSWEISKLTPFWFLPALYPSPQQQRWWFSPRLGPMLYIYIYIYIYRYTDYLADVMYMREREMAMMFFHQRVNWYIMKKKVKKIYKLQNFARFATLHPFEYPMAGEWGRRGRRGLAA